MIDFNSAINELSEVVTSGVFNKFKNNRKACFEVVNTLVKPVERIVKPLDFKVDNKVLLSFREAVPSRMSSTFQVGQQVLRLRPESGGVLAIVDPACYLYDIGYSSMPIAVGDYDFVNDALTEIYSSLTGINVNVRMLESGRV